MLRALPLQTHVVALCVSRQPHATDQLALLSAVLYQMTEFSQNFAGLIALLRKCGLQHRAATLLSHGYEKPGHLDQKADQWHLTGLPVAEHCRLLEAIRGETQLAVPQSTQVPPRQEALLPVRRPAVQGNLLQAIQSASPSARQQTLEEFHNDIYARSTIGPRAARWRTWCRLAAAWGLDPLPINSTVISAVAASLKAGQYRSGHLYLSTARQMHVERYQSDPGPHVDQCIRDAIRSLQRGIGPGRLKDAFQMEILATNIPIDSASRDKEIQEYNINDDFQATDILLIGTWFLLRGAEIRAARRHHLQVQDTVVTFTLPIHKTDTQGSLIQRQHFCDCDARHQPLCPVHAARRHLHRLHRLFRQQVPEQPLFPNNLGTTMSSNQLKDMVTGTLQRLGVETTRPGLQGERLPRFGEHVLRVSGAQFFARAGLELYIIQLMGRWGSRAIERYVQDAYLMPRHHIRLPQLQLITSSSAALPEEN